jgi:hypothetical protein
VVMLVQIELQLCCCSLHASCCYFRCMKPYGEKFFFSNWKAMLADWMD